VNVSDEAKVDEVWELAHGAHRRSAPMRALRRCAVLAAVACALCVTPARGAINHPDVQRTITGGLDWLAYQQHKLGHWTAQGRYPTAMTALAGMAMLCEGSTTTQGKYAENIRRAVSFLTQRSRPNGLIGDSDDDRYTYGHGFAMLFLSEVLGEEEDQERRDELIEVLTKAVIFTGQAQTAAGGWGYVSAKDLSGGGYYEGSTTITQVQGLRGCRNAGIPVPTEVIEKAVKYIHDCTMKDGAVQYSSKGGGGRPAIIEPGQLWALALRAFLLRPGAVSRRRRGVGGVPRSCREAHFARSHRSQNRRCGGGHVAARLRGPRLHDVVESDYPAT
jgi:hypothetical protein